MLHSSRIRYREWKRARTKGKAKSAAEEIKMDFQHAGHQLCHKQQYSQCQHSLSALLHLVLPVWNIQGKVREQ